MEGAGPETVSQHRAAVVLSWFGNDLEGRRLRRPRYQGEDPSLLGVGEAPGGASACTCLAPCAPKGQEVSAGVF